MPRPCHRPADPPRGRHLSVAVWVPLVDAGPDGRPAVLAGSRWRSIGPENAGAAAEGWMLVEQRVGPVALVAEVMVGRGLGERTDVDAEGVAGARVRLAPGVHAGVEGRARTEIEDELETEEDVGRPAEIVAAGVSSWTPAPGVSISTLAGWRSPRGSADPGAIVVGAITRSF